MASPPKAFRFPVYQIDFSAVASGKRVAATKRRIRWRFGFPNRQALEAGRTGTDCRGEEHEIVIVWSITSGKRQVLMDGKEIHYASSRTNVMDHSWSTRGNHVMKVICHASPPLSATPGFRQYDLLIDGQSFFTMPKVYELGIRGFADRGVPRPQYDGGSPERGGSAYYGGGRDVGYDNGYGGGGPPALGPSGIPVPTSRQEEEEELQMAIQASLQESAAHLGEHEKNQKQPSSNGIDNQAAAASTSDLLDFGGDDYTSSTPSLPAPPPPMPAQSGFSNYPATSSMSIYDSSAMMPVATADGYPTAAAYGGGGAPAYGAPPPQSYGGGYGAPAPGPYLALPPPVPAAAYGGPAGAPPFTAAPPPAGAPDAFLAGGGGMGMGSTTTTGQFFDTTNPLVDDPFAPKPPPPPSHREIASEILSAYGPTPTAAGGYYPPPSGVAPTTPMAGYGDGGGFAGGTPLTLENGGTPAAAVTSPSSLTMNGLADTEAENKPADPFEAALKKLVNVDHIDEPAEEVVKLTMKKQEIERKKKNLHKSAPKAPVAAQIVGSHATLAQIQSVKPAHNSSSDVPKEGIMKAPPAQAWNPNAGALVVHGTHPPPLQQPGFVGQGFGAGYNPYAYQQQQHQQYMMQQQQQQYQYR